VLAGVADPIAALSAKIRPKLGFASTEIKHSGSHRFTPQKAELGTHRAKGLLGKDMETYTLRMPFEECSQLGRSKWPSRQHGIATDQASPAEALSFRASTFLPQA
jgi:hypothetical protein